MQQLFDEFAAFETYAHVLKEPFSADARRKSDPSFNHFSLTYIIKNESIQCVNKIILLNEYIECLYFLVADLGRNVWEDDRHWFVIGKLKNNLLFVYETNCSGTGFGFCEESKLILCQTPEQLTTFGLTDKHRNFIEKYIKKRFIVNNDVPRVRYPSY